MLLQESLPLWVHHQLQNLCHVILRVSWSIGYLLSDLVPPIHAPTSAQNSLHDQPNGASTFSGEVHF